MKELAMSPTAPQPVATVTDSDELLGSLTTVQQQRTSARVIKKLRLEPVVEAKRDTPDCEIATKPEDKDKFPTVKQRMPKALWSADEKNLFFEALNEYGKDFDAITSYICSKMKKKGMADANLKTKIQVSHFYYRTWHKLSKFVHFDENVKKVAQELYALINYGELRKKLVSVNGKIYSRLGEMVLGGSIMVRSRGKNIRVRTPMCQALRKLNHMCERACGTRVWSRACCVLRARDAAAWTRVQAAAHNPRTAVSLPLRTSLKHFIEALSRRWMGNAASKKLKFESTIEEVQIIDTKNGHNGDQAGSKDDLEGHLQLETERIIAQELKLPRRPVLHLGPRPEAAIHLPVISPSEQLSSHKICFSSYLERVRDKDGGHTTKIRTPKRQRKDSTTDKDKEVEPKKLKSEDSEAPKIIDIDDTAVDGIELMATFKGHQDDDDKPSEDGPDDLVDDDVEKEPDRDRDRDMSEKERDSYSEMEDDEKYMKSESDKSDNESDHGKDEKKERHHLKVKFRLHTKKHGGTNYTLITDKDQDDKLEDIKIDDAKTEEIKDDAKTEELKEDDPKPEIDVELATRQIRKGWSVFDAGELTVGDLYLMFGSGSKLELDYWWAEPTPPLPQPQPVHKSKSESEKCPPIEKEKQAEKKTDKSPEKDCEATEEDNRRESDTDIFSPKNAFGQDSNDGMSGDERKTEHNLLSSPEHKSCSSLLKLTSKLINRPVQPPTHKPYSDMADRK